MHKLSSAIWIFPESPAAPLAWAMTEAMEIVTKLIGEKPIMQPHPGTACLSIIIGSPQSQPRVHEATEQGLLTVNTLGQDDYQIRSASLDGQAAVLIAGRNDRAAMYGLYAFLEQLGCRFLFSGDVLPDYNPDLAISPLDITGHTDCPWRGTWLGCSFTTIAMMSLVDYERMFTQMAKMRMNRVIYYIFENEPFLDYEYRGERKIIGDNSHPESACMALGRQDAGSYRVADVPVGKEKFDRAYIAPLEFQNARTSAEQLDTGTAFMQQLIRLGNQRGIGTWISFDSTFVSLNMAKYIRPMARPSETYGALTSFTDPAVTEINRCRLESIIRNYADIEGILFQITEGAYEDPYPESQAVLDREWPRYAEAYAMLQNHWSKHWVGEERQRTYMRADIGFVERMKQTLASAKALKPDLKLGVLTVCKAYLLTHLDTVLPKDMPFIDIESQSLWTVDGAPLHLFQQIKNRECALVPRAYDDGSLAGMQFNLNLYQRDGFLASRTRNGTSGLVVQISHQTGNDHNVGFIADGMWNESLTPEQYYDRFSKTIFGEPAAGIICDALKILEENELHLGGRGNKNLPYSLKPYELHVIRAAREHAQPFFSSPWAEVDIVNTFHPRTRLFDESIIKLNAAARLLEKGMDQCRPAGRNYLAGMIQRTGAYVKHLRTLCLLPEVFIATARSFVCFDRGDVAGCRNGLHHACMLAARSEQQAIEAATAFAECANGSTDLAVLWMVNHAVIGARVLRQYLGNIAAYYDGREYWHPVDWDLFYGVSPFPTYSVEGASTMVFG